MEGMEQKRSALESDFVSSSKIINKLITMSKNANIDTDLSQVLDEFLEKLGECDKYLQNGILNMNFAEAALVLQSSADLYSKKVDLLWDIIFDYQKRMLLSEEHVEGKEHELERVEERKRKYKRKRKTNADESQTAKLVNNFSFGQVEDFDYLNQNYEVVDLSKEWSKFKPKTTDDNLHEHVSNRDYTFLPDSSVHNEDNQYIGRYNQFHSTTLIEEIFHLEKHKLLADDHQCVTKMRIDTYVINDFYSENSIPSTASKDSYTIELNKYINNFLQMHNHPEKDLFSSSVELSQCKKSFVSLERLPFNILKDKLRRVSVVDSLFSEDHMSTISEDCPSPSNQEIVTFDQVNGNLENRSKSCSQDSAFYEDVDESVNNEECVVDTCIPIDGTAVTQKNMITVDGVAATDLGTQNMTSEVAVSASEELPANHVMSSRESRLTLKLKKNIPDKTILTRQKPIKNWSSILDSDEEEEQKPKRRKVQKRISEKVLIKLATGITAKYRDFEIFCRLHYQAADGEGTVWKDMTDTEESDGPDVHSSSEDEDEVASFHDEEASVMEEEHEEETEDVEDTENIPDILHPTISPILPNTPSCSTQNDDIFTSTPITSRDSLLPISGADFEQEEISRKNVREWRSFILPKLSKMENRADFDIHDYGSKIIEPSRVGENRKFKDIVKGKNSGEVARFFVATLQLANTHNVEIAGAVPGALANDGFSLKTLDKTKHHELLEEYQAPSEETFKERLERVKALSPKVDLHSGCCSKGPAAKKIRFTYLGKKC